MSPSAIDTSRPLLAPLARMRAGSRYPPMTSIRCTAFAVGIVDSACHQVPACNWKVSIPLVAVSLVAYTRQLAGPDDSMSRTRAPVAISFEYQPTNGVHTAE